MSGLKRVIETQLEISRGAAGGAISAATQESLASYGRQLSISFWLLFLFMLALLALGIFGIIVLVESGQIAQTTAFAAAVGLTGAGGGIVQVLRGFWSEWSRTALLCALLSESSDDLALEVLTLVNKTLK